MDLEQCPWKSSRWSPRKVTLQLLCDYISKQKEAPTSILELGCGVSTWYLNQLNFKYYTAVEEYEPAIKDVRDNLPHIDVFTKWTEIPKIEYQYILIDSQVGGDATNGCQREKPLVYIMENKLFNRNSTLIVHDYNKVKKYRGDYESREGKRYMGWNKTVDDYGWKITEEIICKRCFGIYKFDLS